MLCVDIPPALYEVPGSWDGKSKRLMTAPAVHLELEHSLLSIAKWESKWKIPFLDNPQLSVEQFLDYCRCMTINRQKDPNVYRYLRQKDADKIREYISDTMSAHKIRQKRSKKRGPSIPMTSEYIYWLMIQHGIPFDCDKWHFGRLMALIDICSADGGSGGGEKMSYRERQKFYAELNGQRRKALGTKG